ncbi:MAG: hypothetical protein ACRDLA_19835, partial [Thermoleophilaceae bacterium]
LPTLLIPLRGEVAINVRANTDTDRGKLVSTFGTVPDAPVSRFELKLSGGRDGILVATRNICRRPRSHVTDIEVDGQNGKRADQSDRMGSPCKRRARLRGIRTLWRANRLTVAGFIARKAKRRVRVTVRCGDGRAAKSTKPRRGRFRTTLRLGRRCDDASKARVVIRYRGGPKVKKGRKVRTVRR